MTADNHGCVKPPQRDRISNGSVCRPCWIDWNQRAFHTGRGCHDRWRNDGEWWVCMCGCAEKASQ